MTGTPSATPAPVVTRVVDGTTYHVELDMEPVAAVLLRDIAVTLASTHTAWRLHLLGKLPMSDPAYVRHLNAVLTALAHRRALTVHLHPDAAEDLSGALFDAKDEPDVCTGFGGDACENYATDRWGRCPTCAGRADDTTARIQGVR